MWKRCEKITFIIQQGRLNPFSWTGQSLFDDGAPRRSSGLERPTLVQEVHCSNLGSDSKIIQFTAYGKGYGTSSRKNRDRVSKQRIRNICMKKFSCSAQTSMVKGPNHRSLQRSLQTIGLAYPHLSEGQGQPSRLSGLQGWDLFNT